MYDYLIIHGSYGTQFENWFPWLFNELAKAEKRVLVPQFPVISQSYRNWTEILSVYDKYLGENTSVIAHSLGPAFILDYILQNKKKVNNLYLVAPFYGLINIPEFDEVNKTFFIYQSLIEAKNYFNKAWCLFSDNDPYVPRSMSEFVASQIGATTEIVVGGGHLNKGSGYIDFKNLLKVITDNG
jgi:predicted alpha/beta hydrolase family esterase